MSDTRSLAHQLIDRLPEAELTDVVHRLEEILDPVTSALRSAPVDDESEDVDERRAVEEARAWLDSNGGRGIPHGEAMQELGLE